MKSFLKKNKEKVLLTFLIAFLGIIYFSYNIIMTWDSSEYLGLADIIGTSQMQSKWIAHRGILFPLLLKIAKPFGLENKIFMLILMFVFYVVLIITLYAIYIKLKKEKLLEKTWTKCFYWVYCLFIMILNPIIFGYYHALLTEFVSITITILMCCLSWKWIDITYNSNKKKTIVYTIIFSILTVVMYQTKQSLLPLTVLPILTALIISIINNCKKNNILTKIISFVVIILMLGISLFMWKSIMKESKVIEKTIETRFNNITTSKKAQKYNETILQKYFQDYKKIICLENSVPIWFAKENVSIPLHIYREGLMNHLEFNPDFKEYAENYISVNKPNFIAKIYNKYVENIIKTIITIMKINLAILPFIWIISIICYLIYNKKTNKNALKILEFIVILYTTSFGGIMSYVVFDAAIDRYVIPMVIPMFLADLLAVSLIIKKVIKK